MFCLAYLSFGIFLLQFGSCCLDSISLFLWSSRCRSTPWLEPGLGRGPGHDDVRGKVGEHVDLQTRFAVAPAGRAVLARHDLQRGVAGQAGGVSRLPGPAAPGEAAGRKAQL